MSPRQASVALFVFGETIADHPGRRIERAQDPAWFDGFRSGSMRAIAERQLGPGAALLDSATVAYAVIVETSATDLSYLEAAWAEVRALVAAGGTVVLDAHALTYRLGADLPPSVRLEDEIAVVYETTTERPDHAHALHTRGMKKFGAPDLIALCADADAPLVSAAVSELAQAIARGAELGEKRHRVEVSPGVHWVLVPDEHGLARLLQLDNTARVLVDGDGHDLVGIVARLHGS